MSHQTQIQAGVQRLVTELNAAKAARGDLNSLSTTDKTSIIAAINEVLTLANNAASSGGASINDASSSSTTETWSITKIASEISLAIDNITGVVPGTLDTLMELAALAQSNESGLATFTAALNTKLSIDSTQSLSAAQQQTGRNNLDVYSKEEIGDVTFDYVADIEATLS